jgi:hypothetical protein
MSYNGIYKFILLSCTAIGLLQVLQNDTSSRAFSQLKQQIPNITENSSLRDIQNVAEQHKMLF